MKVKTHCIHGHEYTSENTLRNKKTGHRFCRICHNAASKARDCSQYQKDYRAKRKENGWKRTYSKEECERIVQKATLWNATNKVRRRKQPCKRPEYLRQKLYGLTPERYKGMYEEQGGVCALQFCGRPIECVDHCHVLNFVRGLLCKRCNVALGLLNDNPMLMVRAAEYITNARLNHTMGREDERHTILIT